MSDEKSENPGSSPSTSAEHSEDTTSGDEKNISRLETRLFTAEAQLQALQERMIELSDSANRAKTRALWSRIFLLGALLAGFFFMRSLKGG